MQITKAGYFFIFIFILAVACLIFGGCVRTQSPAPTNEIPVQEIRIHMVKFPNENLSMIALWYTGNEKNWSILSTYNGHLRSASELASGDLIRIPATIMVRTDSMTANFVIEQESKLRRSKKKQLATTSELQKTDQQDLVTQEPEVVPEEVNKQPAENSDQDKLIENLLPQ